MINAPQVTLMVTCIGGPNAPVLINQLRCDSYFDYRIIGVDSDGAKVVHKFVDSVYVVPKGNDPLYIDSVCKIVEQESEQIILPGSDEETLALASCRERLKSLGTIPLVSSEECLNLITDKELTYRRLAEFNISVPEFTAVDLPDDLVRVVASYSYPEKTVIVKPSRSRGNRGVHVLLGQDNPPNWLGDGAREHSLGAQQISDEMFDNFISFDGSTLVMPCLFRPAFDVDLVASGNGPVVIVRERINPSGIPFLGNRIVNNPEIKEYCSNISDVLNLDAIHDIDLMTDADGIIQILEVNPRASGSLSASLVAGFRLVDVAIGHVLGYSIMQSEPDHEILVIPSESGMHVVGLFFKSRIIFFVKGSVFAHEKQQTRIHGHNKYGET